MQSLTFQNMQITNHQYFFILMTEIRNDNSYLLCASKNMPSNSKTEKYSQNFL